MTRVHQERQQNRGLDGETSPWKSLRLKSAFSGGCSMLRGRGVGGVGPGTVSHGERRDESDKAGERGGADHRGPRRPA